MTSEEFSRKIMELLGPDREEVAIYISGSKFVVENEWEACVSSDSDLMIAVERFAGKSGLPITSDMSLCDIIGEIESYDDISYGCAHLGEVGRVVVIDAYSNQIVSDVSHSDEVQAYRQSLDNIRKYSRA